ncbi:MAG: aspartate aminotransferase, partial [Solirubrobacteraceae bacterium]|nr:aspartate aminotransferase [Solirubrobacteraceae bacterium]
EAAAAELTRTRGVPVAPGRTLIANGAKPFLFFTVLATCEPGDEVIHPDPGFPIYESAIRWAGATPVPLPLREADDFSFSPDELAAKLTPRTRLVILNSPQNPTGGVLSAADVAGAAEALRDSRAWVLSDEVYSRLLYDSPFVSIASLPGMLDRTIVLDSFSKTYAMTGWRCGYAAVPQPLVEPLTRFFVNSTSCVPPFVQRAGIAALTGPQEPVTAMVAEFRARRDLLVAGLEALPGVHCRTPHGAFYAFPNVRDVPLGAAELADRLLEEAGVALLTGASFGRAAEHHLRLSYAASHERLLEALQRMRAFLERL